MKKWAFLIGVSKYKDYDPFNPLEFCNGDINLLGDVLEINGGFNVIKCTTDNISNIPNKNKILRIYNDILSDIEPGDLFIFYFEGHGGNYKGKDYIFPRDAIFNKKRETILETTLIDLEYLVSLLKEEHGDECNAIFIIDACRERISYTTMSFKSKSINIDPYDNKKPPLTGIYKIFSCVTDENSHTFEYNNKMRSIFTFHFIQSLQRDVEMPITLGSILDYLKEEVPKTASRKKNKSQNPHLQVPEEVRKFKIITKPVSRKKIKEIVVHKHLETEFPDINSKKNRFNKKHSPLFLSLPLNNIKINAIFWFILTMETYFYNWIYNRLTMIFWYTALFLLGMLILSTILVTISNLTRKKIIEMFGFTSSGKFWKTLSIDENQLGSKKEPTLKNYFDKGQDFRLFRQDVLEKIIFHPLNNVISVIFSILICLLLYFTNFSNGYDSAAGIIPYPIYFTPNLIMITDFLFWSFWYVHITLIAISWIFFSIILITKGFIEYNLKSEEIKKIENIFEKLENPNKDFEDAGMLLWKIKERIDLIVDFLILFQFVGAIMVSVFLFMLNVYAPYSTDFIVITIYILITVIFLIIDLYSFFTPQIKFHILSNNLKKSAKQKVFKMDQGIDPDQRPLLLQSRNTINDLFDWNFDYPKAFILLILLIFPIFLTIMFLGGLKIWN